MRWQLSILSFVLTFILGVCSVVLSFMTDDSSLAFTKEQAARKIGERVRHYESPSFKMMKCLGDGPCVMVNDGEYGTVIGIEQVPSGGYFLKVRWDHPTNNYISYFSRYTHYESLVGNRTATSN
jgi:hypothetical protein